MSTNDGGPAFPVQRDDLVNLETGARQSLTHDGMSLRDWFAGQALAGFLADKQRTSQVRAYLEGKGIGHDDIIVRIGRHVARLSYGFADAMIVERAVRDQPPDDSPIP